MKTKITKSFAFITLTLLALPLLFPLAATLSSMKLNLEIVDSPAGKAIGIRTVSSYVKMFYRSDGVRIQGGCDLSEFLDGLLNWQPGKKPPEPVKRGYFLKNDGGRIVTVEIEVDYPTHRIESMEIFIPLCKPAPKESMLFKEWKEMLTHPLH